MNLLARVGNKQAENDFELTSTQLNSTLKMDAGAKCRYIRM